MGIWTERVDVASKTVLSGTSTVLDIVYELSGRRAAFLHQGATFLYDLARPEDANATEPAEVEAKEEPVEVKETPVEVKETPVEIKETPVEIKETPPQAIAAEATIPIEGYDKLNVKAVQGALEGLDPEALRLVRRYEQAHKNRKTVVRAIDKLVDP